MSDTCERRTFVCAVVDDRGSIAILFALCLLVISGVAGLAIDFSYAYRARIDAQNAADAAALAAAGVARDYLTKSKVTSGSIKSATTAAAESASTYFAKNFTFASMPTKPDVKLAVTGRNVSVSVGYSFAVNNSFGALFGLDKFDVAGTSSSVASLPPYIELHLLIDTSGSMALGASQAEQDQLRAKFGCAFACHDGAPVDGYADAYAWAVGNGITLRLTALNQGILALMDKIDSIGSSASFIDIAVHSFDTRLTNVTPLTNDTAKVRSKLPTAPATSNETEGATRFDEIIGPFVDEVGAGGDGSAADKPMKLVILATDGAHDLGRTWVSNLAERDEVRPFGMGFCEDLKDNNVKIGIIHTPYLEMMYDWGYAATLGQPSQIGGPATRADDIPIVFKKCAGARYVEASDTKAIVSAFSDLFTSLLAARLTQ
ncbi:MAG: pilus assembly protein TadG-related protein [Hyphomicrobium sp.]|nr:pilus assembly protein TadG-related protein [Hyphomicrobium sp.]